MNTFVTVLVVFGLLGIVYLEELHDSKQHQYKAMIPVAVTDDTPGESEDREAQRVGAKNVGLSAQNISEIQDLAKNISHSKGLYRETENEVKSEDDIRRSILKKVAVASESDALKAILETFDTNENKLQLLEQMEFLVHQFDVAVNFASQGGIKTIVPLLFSSDDEIVSSAASVLGAAMQSNPTVQKIALQNSVGKNLLALLSHKSPVVLSRSVFALACYLRNAPEAQEEFISMSGVPKLADIIENNQISTNTKLKVINLFGDLAVEQQTANLYPNDRSSEKNLLLEKLFSHEMQKYICRLIPLFLDLEDFDTHQKIITAMTSVQSVCHKDFKSEKISDRLKKLLKIYDPDSNSEGPLYPNIDQDLKISLHNDLFVLIKEISEEVSKSSTVGLLKSEL